MDLSLSEEQEFLQRSAREFLDSECPPKLVRAMETDAAGFPVDLWRKMAELGWQGLALPEAYGGSDGTYLDLIVLLEEMGRALVPGPFLPSVVPCASTIFRAGTEDQKQAILPAVADGRLILTWAQQEPATRYVPFNIETTLSADLKLNGTKLFVSFAHVADSLLVVAKDGDGLSLMMVDQTAPGVTINPLVLMDAGKQSEVVFKDVQVSAENFIGTRGGAKPIIERALDDWTVASCAWMVGQASKALDMAVEYSKQRVQFGRPIGSFQALQHKAADMALQVEGSRLVTYQAAWAVVHGDSNVTEAVSTAKAWVSESTRHVCLESHQMHGAIGFTMEYDLQLYTRRAKVLESALGDADYHRQRLAAAIGLR